MRVLKVSCCVPIRRAVAAANMPAAKANSQVHPARPNLQALLATCRRSVECPWGLTRYMLTRVGKVDGGVSHAGIYSCVVCFISCALDVTTLGTCGLPARGAATRFSRQ